MDNNNRNRNLIMSGIPEENVTIFDEDNNNEPLLLDTDNRKVTWLLQFIGNGQLVADVLDSCEITHLGNVKVGYNRILKITLPSAEIREDILKNAAKLKNAPTQFKKVFIKKDLHPVYVAENNRLRNKMFNLKKKPENNGKEKCLLFHYWTL